MNKPLSGNDIVGVAGADHLCYKQARRARVSGTYRALLTSRLQTIESIVVTSSLYSTQQDIKVGSTYEQVKESFPEVKMVRSEIESRLLARSGNFTFLFDGYELNDPGKISSITISR